MRAISLPLKPWNTRRSARRRNPAKPRPVTAAELAHVVTFLASPRSVAITGDAIAAGGGIRGAIHY